MAYDLLIRNGRVIDPTSNVPPQVTDIAIAGEKICALAGPGQLSGDGANVIAADGLYVFPGMIDPHVHVTDRVAGNMRGGFELTSLGAIHGGTTTFCDFTITLKSRELLKALDDQRAEADGIIFSDFCLHAGVPPMETDDLRQIPEAIAKGFPSFKCFMLSSRGRPEIEDSLLFGVMETCARHGGLPGVHAENGKLIAYFSQRLLKEGKSGIRYFAASRPNVCEAEAVQRALTLARAANSALYVYHVSSAEGANLIRKARHEGLPVYGETCPHYLIFTDAVYGEELGPLLNRQPPIRSQRDQDALWEALADGTLSCVGTDDVATTLARKRQAPSGPDFMDLPGGMPQIETRLALLYSEGVGKNRITLNRMLYLLSTGPARIFGLYPQKGTISVGSDADLVLFDPNLEKTIAARDLHCGADYTVYEGWKVKGWPVTTMLRGEIVADRGTLVNKTPRGRCCLRKLDPLILREPAA
ncbi:MAG: dihydropyrimidinase [Deltaproteobacteria bacterium]|nr:dihydropyrimidinase [Deltaproteobacteria bacterium]